MRRNEPHWLLNDADAKAYATALKNALRHIPIRAAQKTIDFSMLAFMAFNFEMPRIYVSSQLAAQRRQGRTRGPAQVFQFNQKPPPPPGTTTPPAGNASPSSSSPPAGGPQSANGSGVPGDMSIEPETDEARLGPM